MDLNTFFTRVKSNRIGSNDLLDLGSSPFVLLPGIIICFTLCMLYHYLKWLEIMIKHLVQANLETKRGKSQFCFSSVEYLVFIVNS